MLKLKAFLVLILLITIIPVQQAEAQRICCLPNPTCMLWCWLENQVCENLAERDYDICIKNGEEAACRATYNFEIRICALAYNQCWDGC